MSGGSLTSPLVLKGGAATSAIKLDKTDNGQIVDNSDQTLFGFRNNDQSNLYAGVNSYTLNLRGYNTRPKYNGNNLALQSDVTYTHSSTEKATNFKWTNGSTIYEMAVTTTTGSSVNSWNTLLTTAASTSQIISTSYVVVEESGGVPAYAYPQTKEIELSYDFTNHTLREMHTDAFYNNKTIIVIIEYIK